MSTEKFETWTVATPSFSRRLPPHVYFLISALFHYLGPSFAVLLFSRVAPSGVAWLRITTAAALFGIWRRPWRAWAGLSLRCRIDVLMLGVVLAAMNTVFYEAIDRLPLATVGTIEFLGPTAVAAWSLRTPRNSAALALAVTGVMLLSHARISAEWVGLCYAFANCALFVGYIVLGHRISSPNGGSSINGLACAMVIASVVALPVGIHAALPALADVRLFGAAVGVGVSSSVIPYVCDQLAMSRLPRASFALLLALLPASAALIGFLVLQQVPSRVEFMGIALIITAIALHRADEGGGGR